MATFIDRVRSLSGSISNVLYLNGWLEDGYVDVAKRLIFMASNRVSDFSQEKQITPSGLSLMGFMHIYSVYNSDGIATEANPGIVKKILDSDSIYKATDKNPRFYKLNGKLYIVDGSGISNGYVSVVAPITMVYSNESENNLPEDFINAVCVYASIQNVKDKIIGYLITDYVESVVAPSIGSFDDVSVLIPTYLGPNTIVFPVYESYNEIDLSSVGDPPIFSVPEYLPIPDISINQLILSSPPVVSINMSKELTDAVKAGEIVLPTLSVPDEPEIGDLDISSISVPVSPNPPDYSEISIESEPMPVYDKPAEIEGIETFFDGKGATPPLPPTIGDFDVITIDIGDVPVYSPPDGIEDVGTWLDEIIGDPPSPPVLPEFEEINIGIEDVPIYILPEKASTMTAEIAAITTKIDTNQDLAFADAAIKKVSQIISDYSTEVGNSTSSFNAEMETFKALIQKEIEESRLKLDRESANRAGILQKYSTEVQAYQASIGQYNIQVAKASYFLGVFAQNVSLSINKLNAEIEIYKTKISAKIEENRLNHDSDSQEKVLKLQKFLDEIQLYQANISNYSAEIQRLSVLVSEFSARVGSNANEFNGKIEIYKTETQKNVEEIRLRFEKENAEYSALIQIFLAEIQRYQFLINSAIAVFTATEIQYKINMWGSDYANRINAYAAIASAVISDGSNDISRNSSFTDGEVKLFAAELSKKAEENKEAIEVYNTSSNIELQRWVQEEIAGKQARWIAEMQNAISVYSAEISERAAEFEAAFKVWSTRVANIINKYQVEKGIDIEIKKLELSAVIAKQESDIRLSIESLQNRILSARIDLEIISEKNRRVIDKYIADVQKYQVDVSFALNEATVNSDIKIKNVNTLRGLLEKLYFDYNSIFIPFKIDNGEAKQ